MSETPKDRESLLEFLSNVLGNRKLSEMEGDADAVLSVLGKAGLVIVPKQETLIMQCAGNDAIVAWLKRHERDGYGSFCSAFVWDVMLAASPFGESS